MGDPCISSSVVLVSGKPARAGATGGAASPPVADRSLAARLFAILDAFTAPPATSLTLSMIAHRSGIPLSTVHRLVAEWVAWGGLARQADGRYVSRALGYRRAGV
ncbi:MAG: helix-turn-helix domain-containing protein [Ramlibacter sp.]|nr:helix-turn-helix domain-containing protein [Cryobacterium sp.]